MGTIRTPKVGDVYYYCGSKPEGHWSGFEVVDSKPSVRFFGYDGNPVNVSTTWDYLMGYYKIREVDEIKSILTCYNQTI